MNITTHFMCRTIVNVLVEKGRERYVAQVKDDQCKHERDYVVFHLPKSQVKLLTDFNNRRIQIVGDLRMYI